jgi:hypothetical protein
MVCPNHQDRPFLFKILVIQPAKFQPPFPKAGLWYPPSFEKHIRRDRVNISTRTRKYRKIKIQLLWRVGLAVGTKALARLNRILAEY